ncbi:hypothetical protein [Streptomyces scabiei]|uniref:hypothetical protein n=1 Tax=Streptomyces scabiei TaxID=1930 RepID=UPI00076595CE|nr:hypothetical protein [Streptomyces scabiei]
MPTTDTFGQGFAALDYGDVPDLKTMGDGLLRMAGQSVMRFASASTRNASLTSPVAGMTAWLNSEKTLTVYDGTAWVAVASGTQAWTNVTLAAGFTNNGNSNGNLQYRVVNLFGESTLMLRGGVNVTYSGSPSVIANGGVITGTALPAAARPTSLRSLTGACSTTNSDVLSVKLDIATDGHIQIVGTTSSTANPKIQPPWVSFNGVFCSL